jgi:hypothetical protein
MPSRPPTASSRILSVTYESPAQVSDRKKKERPAPLKRHGSKRLSFMSAGKYTPSLSLSRPISSFYHAEEMYESVAPSAEDIRMRSRTSVPHSESKTVTSRPKTPTRRKISSSKDNKRARSSRSQIPRPTTARTVNPFEPLDKHQGRIIPGPGSRIDLISPINGGAAVSDIEFMLAEKLVSKARLSAEDISNHIDAELQKSAQLNLLTSAGSRRGSQHKSGNLISQDSKLVTQTSAVLARADSKTTLEEVARREQHLQQELDTLDNILSQRLKLLDISAYSYAVASQ